MKKLVLSIIVPVFNECATIEIILRRLFALNLVHIQKEIIVVDDGSTDGSREVLSQYKSRLRLILHKKNQGKGAAIRTGIRVATGDYILIQDADLEYDPKDIKKLLQIVQKQAAPVVYGSRFKGKANDSVFLHREANYFLTSLTNLLYGSSLSDMETCYKLIRADLLKSLPLTAQHFEFEPEVTAQLLNNKIPIIEIPISYTKRGYGEGKKINVWDFFEAVWTLTRYKFRII